MSMRSAGHKSMVAADAGVLTAGLPRVGSGTAARAVRLRGRIRRRLLDLYVALGRPTGYALALVYRNLLLRGVTVIGVTGSTGKTTAKAMTAAALSARLRGSQSRDNWNTLAGVSKSMFLARPWFDFHVQEYTIGRRGPLSRLLHLTRPKIGIVTSIGTDHWTSFRSMEAIAQEKGRVVEALPEDGVAVLNADDPNVMAMRPRARCRVVTFGLSADADVRAQNVRGEWPERLAFDVVEGGRTWALRTQLCGTHWVPSVLAALAVARALEVPLDEAIRGIESVPPTASRMQPVAREDGVTFIDDSWKAPPASVPPALDFLRRAKAERRVAVFGTISDYAGNSNKIYTDAARRALDVADLVVFVGPRAPKARRADHPKADALKIFADIDSAARFLAHELRTGDLVLLKGSGVADRLWHLIPRRVSAGTPESEEPEAATPGEVTPLYTVVGLGNVGDRYEGTPHNVGHKVLDALAERLGATWETRPDMLVAMAASEGRPLRLVKPMTGINNSGRAFASLDQEPDFAPSSCVLVHDDLDLALGVVRTRLRGSDGGHKGVRSVLQELGTDEIARVKIGVGRPAAQGEARTHVVGAFAPEDLATVDKACATAVERVLELVGKHNAPRPEVSSGASQEPRASVA